MTVKLETVSAPMVLAAPAGVEQVPSIVGIFKVVRRTPHVEMVFEGMVSVPMVAVARSLAGAERTVPAIIRRFLHCEFRMHQRILLPLCP